MPDPKYAPYPGPNMALTPLSLAAVANQLACSYVFHLHINPMQVIFARGMLHRMSADVQENPFAPYVNLVLTNSLGNTEWFLEDINGDAMGCEGL